MENPVDDDESQEEDVAVDQDEDSSGDGQTSDDNLEKRGKVSKEIKA